ncbi:MAG: hypothetical protein H5T84_09720 [Thermoleophilia bacterium]|nr:hypothetical protein [Thermoleophilia bacterium]
MTPVADQVLADVTVEDAVDKEDEAECADEENGESEAPDRLGLDAIAGDVVATLVEGETATLAAVVSCCGLLSTCAVLTARLTPATKAPITRQPRKTPTARRILCTRRRRSRASRFRSRVSRLRGACSVMIGLAGRRGMGKSYIIKVAGGVMT